MLTGKPQISVIIVNYNVKDFLLQCLKSIENARGKLSVEIIVVDNNSNDGSIEFLKPIFPMVKFVGLETNIGFGRANNLGFKEAAGKYILVLNPDTILEENTLEIMYDYMENHPETGVSGCKVLNPDGSFQLACRRGFPTPWVSFCKLFGLQSVFPKSKLFARYNQTFRNPDDTYNIDSVIGAFMFIRREVFERNGGFDESFFMYGEDLDFCYRANESGWKTAYIHLTSIIHYKGESTRRSSINELRHFYNAMEIFSKKHFASSVFILLFLKTGIILRSIIARLLRNSSQLAIILFDILAVNFSLIAATKIRFGEFFNFPDYAYPTVFIVITVAMLFSMLAIGEYFETKPSSRKASFGLLITFFILSSLTYFFKEYAFSRGILLMTIGFTIVLSALFRSLLVLARKLKGKEADRRIAFIGYNLQTERIISAIQASDVRNADLTGIIVTRNRDDDANINLPVIGDIDYLPKIIDDYRLHEIIITDTAYSPNDIIRLRRDIFKPDVRFHIAREYEEVLASRIINDLLGIEPTLPRLNITILRYRIFKRLADIFISFFALTIGMLVIFLLARQRKEKIKKLFFVLTGKLSLVGYYENSGEKPDFGKPGLISLALISKPERLSAEAIRRLNNYYLQNYSLSLDVDIFLKYLLRKN